MQPPPMEPPPPNRPPFNSVDSFYKKSYQTASSFNSSSQSSSTSQTNPLMSNTFDSKVSQIEDNIHLRESQTKLYTESYRNRMRDVLSGKYGFDNDSRVLIEGSSESQREMGQGKDQNHLENEEELEPDRNDLKQNDRGPFFDSPTRTTITQWIKIGKERVRIDLLVIVASIDLKDIHAEARKQVDLTKPLIMKDMISMIKKDKLKIGSGGFAIVADWTAQIQQANRLNSQGDTLKHGQLSHQSESYVGNQVVMKLAQRQLGKQKSKKATKWKQAINEVAALKLFGSLGIAPKLASQMFGFDAVVILQVDRRRAAEDYSDKATKTHPQGGSSKYESPKRKILKWTLLFGMQKCITTSRWDLLYPHASRLHIDLHHCVETLHSYRIQHRDIKPENVGFNEATNRWVLLDYGFIRQAPLPVGEGPILTQFIGTFSYCSDEMRQMSHSLRKGYVDMYWNDAQGLRKTVSRITVDLKNWKLEETKSTSQTELKPFGDICNFIQYCRLCYSICQLAVNSDHWDIASLKSHFMRFTISYQPFLRTILILLAESSPNKHLANIFVQIASQIDKQSFDKMSGQCLLIHSQQLQPTVSELLNSLNSSLGCLQSKIKPIIVTGPLPIKSLSIELTQFRQILENGEFQLQMKTQYIPIQRLGDLVPPHQHIKIGVVQSKIESIYWTNAQDKQLLFPSPPQLSPQHSSPYVRWCLQCFSTLNNPNKRSEKYKVEGARRLINRWGNQSSEWWSQLWLNKSQQVLPIQDLKSDWRKWLTSSLLMMIKQQESMFWSEECRNVPWQFSFIEANSLQLALQNNLSYWLTHLIPYSPVHIFLLFAELVPLCINLFYYEPSLLVSLIGELSFLSRNHPPYNLVFKMTAKNTINGFRDQSIYQNDKRSKKHNQIPFFTCNLKRKLLLFELWQLCEVSYNNATNFKGNLQQFLLSKLEIDQISDCNGLEQDSYIQTEKSLIQAEQSLIKTKQSFIQGKQSEDPLRKNKASDTLFSLENQNKFDEKLSLKIERLCPRKCELCNRFGDKSNDLIRKVIAKSSNRKLTDRKTIQGGNITRRTVPQFLHPSLQWFTIISYVSPSNPINLQVITPLLHSYMLTSGLFERWNQFDAAYEFVVEMCDGLIRFRQYGLGAIIIGRRNAKNKNNVYEGLTGITTRKQFHNKLTQLIESSTPQFFAVFLAWLAVDSNLLLHDRQLKTFLVEKSNFFLFQISQFGQYLKRQLESERIETFLNPFRYEKPFFLPNLDAIYILLIFIISQSHQAQFSKQFKRFALLLSKQKKIIFQAKLLKRSFIVYKKAKNSNKTKFQSQKFELLLQNIHQEYEKEMNGFIESMDINGCLQKSQLMTVLVTLYEDRLAIKRSLDRSVDRLNDWTRLILTKFNSYLCDVHETKDRRKAQEPIESSRDTQKQVTLPIPKGSKCPSVLFPCNKLIFQHAWDLLISSRHQQITMKPQFGSKLANISIITHPNLFKFLLKVYSLMSNATQQAYVLQMDRLVGIVLQQKWVKEWGFSEGPTGIRIDQQHPLKVLISLIPSNPFLGHLYFIMVKIISHKTRKSCLYSLFKGVNNIQGHQNDRTRLTHQTPQLCPNPLTRLLYPIHILCLQNPKQSHLSILKAQMNQLFIEMARTKTERKWLKGRWIDHLEMKGNEGINRNSNSNNNSSTINISKNSFNSIQISKYSINNNYASTMTNHIIANPLSLKAQIFYPSIELLDPSSSQSKTSSRQSYTYSQTSDSICLIKSPSQLTTFTQSSITTKKAKGLFGRMAELKNNMECGRFKCNILMPSYWPW